MRIMFKKVLEKTVGGSKVPHVSHVPLEESAEILRRAGYVVAGNPTNWIPKKFFMEKSNQDTNGIRKAKS